MRLAWFLAPWLAACGGSETVVFVTVEGRPTLSGTRTLRIDVENAGDSSSEDFPLPAGDDLPKTLTITPEGRSGALIVTVTALDSSSQPIGTGVGSVAIVEGGTTQLRVRVDPNDFVLNQMIATGQTLTVSFGHSGRQLAVLNDGSFVALWENFCPLARCDILGRRFDARAVPAFNGTSLSVDDFLINQTSEFTTTPAIAAGEQGYLAAWRAMDDVKAAPLAADAEPQTVTDLVVTSSTVNESVPMVFARTGGFVVVWEQTRAGMTESEVRARLYSDTGTPVSGEFAVSELSVGDQTLPTGTSVPGGDFVVTWLHFEGGATQARGRIFAASGAVVTASDILLTNAPGADVGGANVTRTTEGFLLAFRAATPAAIFMQRFAEDGAPLSTAIPISETPADSIATATIGIRPDGAIGVAWHACDPAFGNMDCDILFRLMHPDGLPSGPEVVVNTTRVGRQDGPSIAPFGADAFLLVWTDGSQLAPDTDGDAVRGRVIYPTLERRDGVIGALCETETDCNQGFSCAGPADRQRCHPDCGATPEGEPCVSGGVCTGGVCAF